MDTALLAARLFLAAVFAVAGGAKLLDLKGSRRALADFGLSPGGAHWFGIILPLSELAIAIILIIPQSAWWAAACALALLLTFVAAIGFNLLQGRQPDCHCFGQLHSAPAGWPTLIRNAILAAIAGFIVWQGRDTAGPGIISWLSSLTTVQSTLLAISAVAFSFMAIGGWFLLRVSHQTEELMLRMDAMERALVTGERAYDALASEPPRAGLPVGVMAPNFQLPNLAGEPIALETLRAAGKTVMLIFASSSCGPCNALLPDIALWQTEYQSELIIAVVSRGDRAEHQAKTDEFRLTHVLLQKDREVAEAYQAKWTPMAVAVRPDGTVGSSTVAGAEAIRALIANTVGASSPASQPEDGGLNGHGAAGARHISAAVNLGDQTPQFRLPDLNGNIVTISEFRDSKVLILFWNPGCGFCAQMLDALKEWEHHPPERAPKLLVISTGTVEANKAQGLRSIVVLDQNFSVGPKFGVDGTPSAVLVSASGKIASQVAVGASAVLALAGVEQER